jgi:predicted metal-dependent phosphoesterase TrpH
MMNKGSSIRADLHLHTTASDGRLTPEQLVTRAVEQGLNVMAVTDHDTVEGIPLALKAASDFHNLNLIPGVEINTDVPGMEVHMLGYFIDFESDSLVEPLKELRDSRVIRAKGMLEKLDKLGMPIKWNELLAIAGDSVIGRPHIAKAMEDAGYVSTSSEAFDKYIGRKGPAYVEHKKMTPVEVVRLIKAVHGIPALAHPANIDNLDTMLSDLKDAGLMGIEVYYGQYTSDIIQNLLALANKYDLITTGGSDYHAFHDERETMVGDIDIPEDCIRTLYALAGKVNNSLLDKFNLQLKVN